MAAPHSDDDHDVHDDDDDDDDPDDSVDADELLSRITRLRQQVRSASASSSIPASPALPPVAAATARLPTPREGKQGLTRSRPNSSDAATKQLNNNIPTSLPSVQMSSFGAPFGSPLFPPLYRGMNPSSSVPLFPTPAAVSTTATTADHSKLAPSPSIAAMPPWMNGSNGNVSIPSMPMMGIPAWSPSYSYHPPAAYNAPSAVGSHEIKGAMISTNISHNNVPRVSLPPNQQQHHHHHHQYQQRQMMMMQFTTLQSMNNQHLETALATKRALRQRLQRVKAEQMAVAQEERAHIEEEVRRLVHQLEAQRQATFMASVQSQLQALTNHITNSTTMPPTTGAQYDYDNDGIGLSIIPGGDGKYSASNMNGMSRIGAVPFRAGGGNRQANGAQNMMRVATTFGGMPVTHGNDLIAAAAAEPSLEQQAAAELRITESLVESTTGAPIIPSPTNDANSLGVPPPAPPMATSPAVVVLRESNGSSKAAKAAAAAAAKARKQVAKLKAKLAKNKKNQRRHNDDDDEDDFDDDDLFASSTDEEEDADEQLANRQLAALGASPVVGGNAYAALGVVRRPLTMAQKLHAVAALVRFITRVRLALVERERDLRLSQMPQFQEFARVSVDVANKWLRASVSVPVASIVKDPRLDLSIPPVARGTKRNARQLEEVETKLRLIQVRVDAIFNGLLSHIQAGEGETHPLPRVCGSFCLNYLTATRIYFPDDNVPFGLQPSPDIVDTKEAKIMRLERLAAMPALPPPPLTAGQSTVSLPSIPGAVGSATNSVAVAQQQQIKRTGTYLFPSEKVHSLHSFRPLTFLFFMRRIMNDTNEIDSIAFRSIWCYNTNVDWSTENDDSWLLYYTCTHCRGLFILFHPSHQPFLWTPFHEHVIITIAFGTIGRCESSSEEEFASISIGSLYGCSINYCTLCMYHNATPAH
jgi:hypothetical protein